MALSDRARVKQSVAVRFLIEMIIGIFGFLRKRKERNTATFGNVLNVNKFCLKSRMSRENETAI